MNAESGSVRRYEKFRVLGAAEGAEVDAVLTYRRERPFAVTVGFRVGGGEVVEWDFARDLVIEGLMGPAGEGDVRIAPSVAEVGVVTVELHNQTGYALLAVSGEVLAEFLAETYGVAEVGAEGEMLDMDAELAALLADETR